jgi:hypothetical protein
MADENETIEIEIKDDPAPKAEDDILIQDAVEEKPAKRREISPREGIQELKQKLELERQARLEAENRERNASSQAYAMRNEVASNQHQLVSNTLDFVKQERANMKAAYSQALSAGDYDAAAEINDRIADMAAKILDLENGKAAMEAQAQQPQQPQQQQPSDSVEAFASRLTPRSASWVRSHPEYVRNPRLNQKMIAAHQMAVADGIEPDTDEYFGYVEDMLQVKNQPYRDGGEESMSGASKPVQRRSSPAAAPVSRSMSSSGGRPNVVTLTPEMREIAKNLGQTPEEYAKNRLALIREGRINSDN